MNAPLRRVATPPQTAHQTPLELRDVSKSYGQKRAGQVQALKPLTLRVPPGELLAVLGPSGCGKTTTLRIVGGFEFPDTGSVFLGERDVTALPPNKRSLGMVFQNYGLFPHLSVGDNVAFGLRMRGVNRADRDRRVRAMLDLVRLQGTEDRTVRQLSGGQQQRIALARALAPEPRILLLDEPLGALDKNLREGMQFELRQIQRQLGITSILVTHDQEEALTMSDRVAVMAHGEIVPSGAPLSVYEHPRSRFVAEFLGTANIFAGTVAGPADDGWRVALDRLGQDLVAAVPARPIKPGERVLVAVRPEQIELGEPGPGRVIATVLDLVFRGATFVYELSCAGHEPPLICYRQTRAPVQSGDPVGLTVAPRAAVILDDPV